MIDPLTLSPLDNETIFASVNRTGRLVIVHEDTLTGGWGAEVAARVADECLLSLEGPIKRVASFDVPAPAAPVLEDAVLPSRRADRDRRPHARELVNRVRMPALGQTSDEIRIAAWLKQVGEQVSEGEPLLEVETDKATLEVEAAIVGCTARDRARGGRGRHRR